MTTATTTLADWLLERLVEDEAVAREATWSDGHGYSPLSYARTVDARHMQRHDPARVLREVAAKRAIIESWQRAERLGTNGLGPSVLRALASVYAGAPGWREEWAL